MHLLSKARSINLVSLVILLSGLLCSCDDNPIDPPSENDYPFAIYLPRNPDVKITDWTQINLENAELADTPWLTNEDIQFYDFSSHLLYLKKNRSELIDYRTEWDYQSAWCGKPFVVVGQGERAYVGYFCCGAQGISAVTGMISDYHQALYPPPIMEITWGIVLRNDADPRPNETVREALKEAGVYRAGLEVEIVALTFYNTSDTTTVEYELRITNNDTETLYVPDPEVMGTSLYHYFTNGLAFYNPDTEEYYFSSLKTYTSGDWDADWYVQIPPGKSIRRTIVLKGYPHLPAGTYLAQATYSVPSKVPLDQIVQNNGRYWLGKLYSEAVGFDLNQTTHTQSQVVLRKSGAAFFPIHSMRPHYDPNRPL